MIHRDTPRSGLRALRLIAIISFLAATGFSNRGWAIVVGSPPPDDQIKLVADHPISASMANKTANKTLNVLCRAANLPHGALPEERLPAEQALSSTDAKNTLDVIQQLSKTQRPLCSPNGAAPNSALKEIDTIGSVDPIHHPVILPGFVAPQVWRVRDIYGQVKANK
jgi:hypothetical protein